MVPIQAADFHDIGIHVMTNVSVPKVDMLKNHSTLAASVPINVSIKLGFVSIKSPRETYFVYTPCIYGRLLNFYRLF